MPQQPERPPPRTQEQRTRFRGAEGHHGGPLGKSSHCPGALGWKGPNGGFFVSALGLRTRGTGLPEWPAGRAGWAARGGQGCRRFSRGGAFCEHICHALPEKGAGNVVQKSDHLVGQGGKRFHQKRPPGPLKARKKIVRRRWEKALALRVRPDSTSHTPRASRFFSEGDRKRGLKSPPQGGAALAGGLTHFLSMPGPGKLSHCRGFFFRCARPTFPNRGRGQPNGWAEIHVFIR